MSVNKFKFVSPGVQVAEIDNSQLPQVQEEMGPVIFGRAERGPALRPVKVGSFSEFVEIFGNPKAGGDGNDVWRNGGTGLAPTYGAYAAQAYLRNSNPVTFVRLLGKSNTDATAAGVAGWSDGTVSNNARGGGTYGLFTITSTSTNYATGTLAAVFYMTTGSMRLRGLDQSGSAEVSGTCTLMKQDSQGNFKMDILTGGGWDPSYQSSNGLLETVTFNFNENDKNYVRKVFNTNPTLTNSTIVAGDTKNYWLGESYLNQATGPNDTRYNYGSGQAQYGILLPLLSGSSAEQGEQNRTLTKAKTPWIISQDLAGESGSYSTQKLFQFETLEGGEWEQQNFKISIADVKASNDPYNPYGTFTVELRLANDSDNAKQIVERYSLCDLNPASNNYIAKKVGDSYAVWSDTERRYREYGNYPNQSKYVRVSVNSDVDNASTNESFLPFGFEGPVRFRGFQVSASYGDSNGADVLSGSFKESTFGQISYSPASRFVEGGAVAPDHIAPKYTEGLDIIFSPNWNSTVEGVPTVSTGTFNFPMIPLRQNTLNGNLSSPKDAYFGVDTSRGTSPRYEPSYEDLVRAFPEAFSAYGDPTVSCMERPYMFSLEDLSYWTSTSYNDSSHQSTEAYYLSGSRADGRSIAVSGGTSNTYDTVLAAGFDSFTVPLQGGFNGLNITEADPFRNTLIDGKTVLNNYAYNSIKMAIDTCSDPEVVECNMMTMPGLTNTALTEHIIKTCEDRADSLAIIDIENGYVPPAETNTSEEARAGSVASAVSSLANRGLNSSYGCAYYPWVQARDSETGKTFWAPPSIAAIGTFSSAQKKSELWFAPAGFQRGGLSQGSAGIPIVNVKQKLTSKQRDSLYEVNINPIASFPAEGIVIFGQKTLQTTPSALDRVNVRRLMIHVKKEISRIASVLLFDQNVQTTWDRFTGQVVPFLNSIKTRIGLQDFKVILDDTTTTPDLVDRNIMYAKIFLKPAKSIEFIAIDFVITSTGASFED